MKELFGGFMTRQKLHDYIVNNTRCSTTQTQQPPSDSVLCHSDPAAPLDSAYIDWLSKVFDSAARTFHDRRYLLSAACALPLTLGSITSLLLWVSGIIADWLGEEEAGGPG